MYVDLGWGGTRVAIAHGRKIAFARSIQLGGRQLDEAFANAMHCDVATARAHRLALDEPVKKRERAVAAAEAPVGAMLNAAARAQAAETPESAEAAVATQPERRVGARPPEYCFDVEPDTASGSPALDLAEVLDTITDELSMCLRYHQGLFSGRSINRVVFLGGEARQIWLCKHLVKCLRISGQLGDPLARFVVPSNIKTPGLGLGEPQPGWAVACGLSTAPPDL
jgi:Tfp pilus assembly PilM family ATPase